MDKKEKALSLAKALVRPSVLLDRSSQIFLLSHMRSRSSALSHVLGSHPDIAGYGELQQSYRSQRDVLKMRVKLYADLGDDFTNARFNYDKILHWYWELDPSVSTIENTKLVLLVREPEPTLSSLISLAWTIESYGNLGDQEVACAYYCSRLEQLVELAQRHAGDFYLVSSEALVDDTETVLQGLSNYIGLNTPLRSDYRTFAKTGHFGHGDMSANLRQGRIMAGTSDHDVTLSEGIISSATEVYTQVMLQLDELAVTA